MMKYTVRFKGVVTVDVDDKDDALEVALDNLHTMEIADYSVEEMEDEP